MQMISIFRAGIVRVAGIPETFTSIPSLSDAANVTNVSVVPESSKLAQELKPTNAMTDAGALDELAMTQSKPSMGRRLPVLCLLRLRRSARRR